MPTPSATTPADPAAEPIPAAALETWRLFLRGHALMARLLEAELLLLHRLPLPEYDVLVQLNLAPEGRLRMAQLADRVVLSRSGLTRLVERLERAGLVERASCPSDARGAYAVLTASGRERLDRAAPDHMRGIRQHFVEPLATTDLHALGRALAVLVAAAEQGRPPAARAVLGGTGAGEAPAPGQ